MTWTHSEAREHRSRARNRVRERITAATCVVALALCAWIAEARGRVDELLLSAGESMLGYGRAADRDEARSISINGADVHVLSGRSADSVDAVLDAFEARCLRAGGAFAQQLARVGATPHTLLDGVLRRDDGERGYVACFDLGGVTMHAAELVARLRAFAAAGDLSAIGDLRFAWVERARDTTSYVALWSEGPLPLRAMFPARGDAPGVDVPGVPRPAGAQRTLSAWQAQRAPLLVAYAATAPPTTLATAYRAQLRAAGFEVHAQRADDGDARNWLLRRGSWLGIAVIARGRDGGSSVALSPLQ